MATGFDPKCLELALHFNDRDLSEQQLHEMAQHIQNVVEDYFLCLDIDAAAAAAAAQLEQEC